MKRKPPVRTEPQSSGPNRAIALKYDGTDLPKVIATGRGDVAAEIIRRAEAADVPLVEDPQLAVLLSDIDLGANIPEPLFRAVAEVLSYAFYVSGRHEDILRRAKQTRDEGPADADRGEPGADAAPNED